MDPPLLTGLLLVATPLLEDPNFRRTVVLVIDDATDEGTIGVIVNRPSETAVGDVLPGWAGYASEPGVMFAGGPVGTESGLALGVPGGEDAPLGWRPLERLDDDSQLSGVGMVDLDTPPEVLGGALASLRIFAGYAGWGREQLRGEINEGAWYVLPATDADVFATRPEDLWPSVLRRQGGDLALVSTFPDDPRLN